MRRATFAGAAVTAFVIAALAGCSQPSESSGEVRRPSPVFTGEVPSFSGPWASEFAEAYRSTNSEVVHRILEKGSITDQDYAEVSSAYVTCMANKGFTATVTGPFGESVTEAGEESMSAEETCNGDIAVIAGLRHSITRNPEHRDEAEIMVACLVTKKLAPPGYSTKDYELNLQSQTFPFDLDSPDFSKCVNDPLRLAANQ